MYVNPVANAASPVPRHKEIDEYLVAQDLPGTSDSDALKSVGDTETTQAHSKPHN